LEKEESSARVPDAARPIHHFANHLEHTLLTSDDEQLRAAYDKLHARHSFRATPGYYQGLLSMLPTESGHSLLDVGCGSGGLLRYAADTGLVVSGVDISEVGLGQARSRVPSADLRVARAEELPFADGSFDLVSCTGSLEHVSDIDRAVREMSRVAKPSGRVLVVVPNSRFVFAFVTHLRQRFFPDESQPVERLASRSEWEEVLTRNGLRITRTAKDNDFFLPTPVLQVAVRGLGKLIPLGNCYQFIFVAEPTRI
jgi:ubiquinone/menaquinone biosynthesis C-methylase UbiE